VQGIKRVRIDKYHCLLLRNIYMGLISAREPQGPAFPCAGVPFPDTQACGGADLRGDAYPLAYEPMSLGV